MQRNKGPIHQYTPEQLAHALQAVEQDGIAVARASSIFGVPRTTLRDKLSGKTSTTMEKVGKKCFLGKNNKQSLI